MQPQQGDLSLLEHPVAQELLQSRYWAELGYVWPDGTPRVTPIAFHWNGSEIILTTPSTALKLKALAKNPRVAVTINSHGEQLKVLMIRGTASVDIVDGVPPEYVKATTRYMGEEQGRAQAEQMAATFPQNARIAVTPEWVGVVDYQTRFPSFFPF